MKVSTESSSPPTRTSAASVVRSRSCQNEAQWSANGVAQAAMSPAQPPRRNSATT